MVTVSALLALLAPTLLAPTSLDAGLILMVMVDDGGRAAVIEAGPDPSPAPKVVPLTNGLTVVRGAVEDVPSNDDTGGDAEMTLPTEGVVDAGNNDAPTDAATGTERDDGDERDVGDERDDGTEGV